MSFRFPYVSIDVETTGLDRQRSHVLQLAAIYDNGQDLRSLPTFNAVIKWPILTYGEEYALNLNLKLLGQAFKNEDVVTIEQARLKFTDWLDKVSPRGRLTAAGKNIAGFDIPMLQNPVNNFPLHRFNHRALDPGSMFYDEFDHIPTLDEINMLTGRKEVSHDALSDCWDVVYAIRYKWKI